MLNVDLKNAYMITWEKAKVLKKCYLRFDIINLCPLCTNYRAICFLKILCNRSLLSPEQELVDRNWNF